MIDEPLFKKINRFTFREKQVYNKMLELKSAGEIADELFITEKTVKFHFTKIYKKLGIEKAENKRLMFSKMCLDFKPIAVGEL